MLGGAGAIAGVGMSVVSTIQGFEDDKARKETERFKQRMDISQKQLDALNNMSGAFKDFSDKMVETLSKMPTQNQYERQMEKIKPAVDYAQSRSFEMSDLSFIRRTGANGIGQTGKKTETRSAQALVSAFGYGDVDTLEIDEIKNLKSDMEKVSDWNTWIRSNLGSRRVVKSSNIELIEKQIDSQIQQYEDAVKLSETFMKEATLKSFKSSQFVDVSEMEKMYREQGEAIFGSFVGEVWVPDTERVTSFVEKMMADVGDITTDSAIKLRNTLIEGIASGADKDSTIANAFRSMFDEMSYDVSSVLSDALFQDSYDDIEKATIEFSDKLAELKEAFKDDPNGLSDNINNALVNGYIPAMAKAIEETRELDDSVMDFNLTMRETLLSDKYDFSEEFVNQLYPIEDALSEMAMSVRGMFSEALNADNYSDSIEMLGSSMSETLVNSLIESTLSGSFQDEILRLSTAMSGVMEQGFSISATRGLQSEFNKAMLQIEQTQQQANILKDILTFDSGDVEYEQVNNTQQYQTGSTQSIINNITNTYRFDVGTLVGNNDASMEDFSIAIKPYLDSLT